MTTEQYVTQTEFAAIEGVSKSEISQRKAKGQLVMKDNLVDVEASRVLREQTRHPERQKHSDTEVNSVVGLSYQKARAVKEQYAAKMAQIAYEKEIGELIQVQAAKLAILDGDAIIRNRLESLPDVLAPQLAHETDEHKVRSILIDQIEIILTELSRTFNDMVD
jgi:hypothetical protein